MLCGIIGSRHSVQFPDLVLCLVQLLPVFAAVDFVEQLLDALPPSGRENEDRYDNYRNEQ